MTRPTLVRADSIDLQDQNSPSAKDHSNHPADTGRPAPHQAEALREVRAEAAEENSRSPRVSREWAVGETTNLHNQIASHDALAGINSSLNNHLMHQDDLAVAQNGGSTAEDGDMADGEGDDGMDDDDMMDKISSSPSIDDGGYSFPSLQSRQVSSHVVDIFLSAKAEALEQDLDPTLKKQQLEGKEQEGRSWPPRYDSLLPSSSPFSQITGNMSSSPFIDTPAHFPLNFLTSNFNQGPVQSEHHHHLLGLYSEEIEEFEEDDYYEEEEEEYEEEYNDDYDDELTDEEIRRRRELYIDPFEEPEVLIQREMSIESYDEFFEELGDEVFQLEDSQNDVVESSFTSTRAEELGLMIPYERDEDEDDDDDDDVDVPYTDDSSRFIDSGWGGECLQDLEDIDFEFVYALHTFIATVEGQANAQKGDTMVLLDDSNSYWWLVRVVKDGSIGYLPAEHIETPTERLARLNKHRNIDVCLPHHYASPTAHDSQLSATMLGDQAEKSKNPLKKAIRRRNAKTVTFSAPTYVEASDVEYSSDEEEGENPFYSREDQQAETQEAAQEVDEAITVEPLKSRDAKEEKAETVEANAVASEVAAKSSLEASSRSSSDVFDSQSEGSRSRNGTVRNTDSFFKDDSVETRKITITPALFRDDSSNPTEQVSNDSRDIKPRQSLDKGDKDSLTDKNKDDKKKKDRKEKKPGMLSGLFKRGKDKKGRGALEDDIDADELIMGKRSTENGRASPVPSKDSQDSSREEPALQTQAQAPQAPQQGQQSQQPQRQPSKLQKQPKPELGSPTKQSTLANIEERKPTNNSNNKQAPAPGRPPPATSVQDPSMRLVQPDDDPPTEQRVEQLAVSTAKSEPTPQEPIKEPKANSAVTKIKTAIATTAESRPEKVRKIKTRQVLDEFDSSEDTVSPVEEIQRDPYNASKNAASAASANASFIPNRQAPQRPIPGAFPDSYISTPVQTPANERSNTMEYERLSESPVQVSPIEPSRSYPPPLMIDTSSQEEVPSPVSSPSPELIEHGTAKAGTQDSTSTSSTATWNDHQLRSFFDDDGEIRDLLTVVYDKSGVVPAGPDHPVTGKMFVEENAKLAEITNRLDNMLGDWLARKMKNPSGR